MSKDKLSNRLKKTTEETYLNNTAIGSPKLSCKEAHTSTSFRNPIFNTAAIRKSFKELLSGQLLPLLDSSPTPTKMLARGYSP